MELTENQKATEEILAQVIVKAWEDETFKKELVEAPFKAIENLTGKKLNLKEGSKMIVTDQTKKDTFYFNIPSKPNIDDLELNEEQLDMVAGGGFWGAVWEITKGPVTIATKGFDAYVDAVAAEIK